MKQRTAFYVWLMVSLIVLGWWYYFFELDTALSRTLRNESQIYLIIGMTVLSFPAGLFYMYVFGFAVYGLNGFGIDLHQYEMLEVLILWAGFVLSGYLQWFILLPFFRKKFYQRQSKTDHD